MIWYGIYSNETTKPETYPIETKTSTQRNFLAKSNTTRTTKLVLENDEKNPYQSFASTKQNAMARWFIQGQSYFAYLKHSIERCEHEIFIAGMILHMELELVRPKQGNKHSLGELLKQKARKGVKIYILLVGSDFHRKLGYEATAKKIIKNFQNLDNFEIMEHAGSISDHLGHSHHEKLVILDHLLTC